MLDLSHDLPNLSRSSFPLITTMPPGRLRFPAAATTPDTLSPIPADCVLGLYGALKRILVKALWV
jgi:hypothetical protein